MKPNNVKTFFRRLEKKTPDPKTELNYTNNFTLLMAVVLSAQMTDIGVNKATKKLFSLVDTPEKVIEIGEKKLKSLIKTVNFFHTKARNIVKLSRILINNFKSRVPNTREELQTLPGVGRKTANVIGSVYFNIPAMPVDTHVFRVSNRIGLTANAKNPLQSELQLLKLFPEDKLNLAHHWLILHGRYVCKARRPECENCGITSICNQYRSSKK